MLKIQNDNITAPSIMEFHPTLSEMQNFSKYIEYMEKAGSHNAGLAKVIPPKGWIARKEGYRNIDMLIPCPVTQHITGREGVYEVYNTEPRSREHGAISVQDFEILANSQQYQTPAHESYEDLERKYWTNLTFNPSIYGADVSGSLTNKSQAIWNIQKLGSILDNITDIKIEGVNTAYLYFGMWKTTFAWHIEDMDLYSINYLHYGAPKSWYAIPPKYGRRFERLAKGYFKNRFNDCPAFLRHKSCILSPRILKQYSIPFNKIIQEAGEFVITFPYSYHSGYNQGYNCAESTNFATERWIEYGKRCQRCHCVKEMVQIDMDVFVKKYQPDLYKDWLEGKDAKPHPEDDQNKKVARSSSEIRTGFMPSKRHPPINQFMEKKQAINNSQKPIASKKRLMSTSVLLITKANLLKNSRNRNVNIRNFKKSKRSLTKSNVKMLLIKDVNNKNLNLKNMNKKNVNNMKSNKKNKLNKQTNVKLGEKYDKQINKIKSEMSVTNNPSKKNNSIKKDNKTNIKIRKKDIKFQDNLIKFEHNLIINSRIDKCNLKNEIFDIENIEKIKTNYQLSDKRTLSNYVKENMQLPELLNQDIYIPLAERVKLRNQYKNN